MVLIGLAAVGLGSGGGSSANLPGHDWTKYVSEIGGSGFTSETLITPANAAQLRQPADWPRQLGPAATQPLVANNLVYSGSFDGHEYAVPAVGSSATGWSTYLGMTDAGSCGSAGVASTGAITSVTLPGQTTPTSVLFVGGGGNDQAGGGQARLYALNARTGAVIWQTPLGPSPATFIWSSPALYTYVSAGVPTTSVYVGVASFSDCPLVQGRVVQLDAATGQIEHSFNVVPNGCIGGSVWGSPTIDTTDGSLYVATGNAGQCNTDESFAEALLKLSASDLSLVDAWRVPRPEQVFDSDFGSTPTVYDGTITPGGPVRPLVGVANKNGTFYVFDRGYVGAGPIARLQIADPGSDPEDGDGSISPSAFDGKLLYVAGGSTTIGGTPYKGSVRAWDPNDLSKPVWEHGFADGPVLGAVTAAPGLVAVGAGPVTYVLSSKDGTVLFHADDSSAGTSEPAPFWGAPSIAHGTLYEADNSGLLYAYTSLLSITTASLPTASIGKPYTATILAVGGLPAYRWTPLGGSLPPGLSLSTTGVISGTANASGTYTFTLAVSDSGSPRQRATLRLGIRVKSGLAQSRSSVRR